MKAAAISPEQIRAIHTIKTKVRLDDGSYRAMLSEYGAASSKDLTRAEADRFLGRLRLIPGAQTPVERTASTLARADGRYRGVLQAMWLALYNLGAVRDRRDTAMHAFVERQTRIPHTRFLRNATDARAAIEALKAWMVREGVRWPASTGDRDRDVRLLKLEILRAQWVLGCGLGALKPLGRPEDCDGLAEYASAVLRGGSRRLGSIDDPTLTNADLDRVSAALGSKIRKTHPLAEGGTDGQQRY